MNPPYNIMDVSGNFIGAKPLGFNQFIASEAYALDFASNIQEGVWGNTDPFFTTSRVSQGIVDHIHYAVNLSPTPPSEDELSGAFTWNSDLLILVLPEISGQYVHFLPHDRFHHSAAYGNQILTFGEYNIDKTAPSGQMILNGGNYSTNSNIVTMSILGSDEMSRVKEVYVYGDVQGAMAETWLPLDNLPTNFFISISGIELILTEETQRKNVSVILRDNAGNTSTVFSRSITFPITRYFFHKTAMPDINMKQSGETMSITINEMSINNPQMQDGTEHGNLSAA